MKRARPSKYTLRPTKLDMSKIPPCDCGGTKFALVGSDGKLVYFAVEYQSCGKEIRALCSGPQGEGGANIDELDQT